MDGWKRDLSKNFSKIVQHVDNPDMIAEYLHYDCTPPVFTETDVDEIKTKYKDETIKNKTRILLNRLCYKPHYPLVALYKAFVETQNSVLRECLVESVERYFTIMRKEVRITADKLPLTESDWQTLHQSDVVTCQVHSADLVRTHKITDGNYLMTEDIRGRAIIINNSNFEKKTQKRLGSEKDIKLLTKTFQQLHFNVKVYEELSAEQIMETLEKESKHPDLRSSQCLILVMMSHGFVSGVKGLDGKEVKFNDFATYFNPTKCPALKDKPKLFFFQSCRRAQGYTEGDNKEKRLQGVENNKDFLFTWACSEGSKSQRCEDTGAWFIQALCCILKTNAHKQHLQEMLTIVNAVVSGIKENEQTCHFIPENRGSLIKNVYFFPGVRGHPGDPRENKTVGKIIS